MREDDLDQRDLDAMLAAPLPDIRDSGFSERVLVQVAVPRKRWFAFENGALALMTSLCLAVLPLGMIGEAAEQLSQQIAGSQALSIALAVLVLSAIGEHLLLE